jgi:hypothetical protein
MQKRAYRTDDAAASPTTPPPKKAGASSRVTAAPVGTPRACAAAAAAWRPRRPPPPPPLRTLQARRRTACECSASASARASRFFGLTRSHVALSPDSSSLRLPTSPAEQSPRQSVNSLSLQRASHGGWSSAAAAAAALAAAEAAVGAAPDASAAHASGARADDTRLDEVVLISTLHDDGGALPDAAATASRVASRRALCADTEPHEKERGVGPVIGERKHEEVCKVLRTALQGRRERGTRARGRHCRVEILEGKNGQKLAKRGKKLDGRGFAPARTPPPLF